MSSSARASCNRKRSVSLFDALTGLDSGWVTHRMGVELWWLIHLGTGLLTNRLDSRFLGEDRSGHKKGGEGE